MNHKILIVTLHYLDGVGGGVFASRSYINALSEIYPCQVTLVYPSSQQHPIQGISPDVKAIPIEDNRSNIQKFQDLVYGRLTRFVYQLPDIIEEGGYDVVVFDNSKVSYNMIDMAHKYGAKAITIHHNCEFEYNRDNSSLLLRPIILYWTKKYEREAIIKSDLNLTLTPEDKKLLSAYDPENKSKIEVIGTFEYLSEKADIFNEEEKSHKCCEMSKFVITGNLSAVQTENSLIPWLEIFYPILCEVFPSHTLTIAGKNPSEKLMDKCKKLGIQVIPSPKDMKPILENADCYICPTSLGGGLKLRIMDGLKSGLPVLSHVVSARGYHEFIEAGYLQSYSSIDEFRIACETLKNLSFSRKDIKKKYEQIFSFASGVNRLRCILGERLFYRKLSDEF